MYKPCWVKRPVTSTRAKASTKIGWTSTANEWGPRVHGTGQRENTRMNVNKYSASGTTHKNGCGDRSTVIFVVVPSIRLEGMAASMTQRKRRKLVISSEGGGSTQCE